MSRTRSAVLAALLLAALGLSLAAGAARAAGTAAGGEKIIVSGASGQLGGLTVKALLARGVAPANLILVSRTPEKLAAYAALGASVRFGDLTQPESLPAAYAGGSRMLLISVMPGSIPRPQLHQRAFDAAVKAGVRHIVYTSIIGADEGLSPLAADHWQSERNLMASGAAWTMLRNGFYADGLIRQAADMVASGRVVVAPNEPKSAPVTREDCAAAAAGALTTPGHDNQAYDITGPELLDRRDIARIVSELSGRPIAVIAQSENPPPAAGPAPGAAAPRGAMVAGPGVLTQAVQTLSGRPATSVRAMLDAHRSEWLAAH